MLSREQCFINGFCNIKPALQQVRVIRGINDLFGEIAAVAVVSMEQIVAYVTGL